MNRPRNRQPRPQGQNQRGGRRGGGSGGGPSRLGRGPPATPQQAAGTVPTVRQVVPGASVFIVLKEDQPTGTETSGVVEDILTRGNHPRGIKVRLRDGQVGRVQRMNGDAAPDSDPTASSGQGRGAASSRFTMRYTDVRNDEFLDGPPPRSLADFMPDFDEPPATTAAAAGEKGVKCPFCDAFEGDEAAVTFHIEIEHLT